MTADSATKLFQQPVQMAKFSRYLKSQVQQQFLHGPDNDFRHAFRVGRHVEQIDRARNGKARNPIVRRPATRLVPDRHSATLLEHIQQPTHLTRA